MKYIITLNKVKESDLEAVGFRAVDLALVRQRFNVLLTFVINNQAFEDFMNENNLGLKAGKILDKKDKKDKCQDPEKAYKEILELFNKAGLPAKLEEELFEAYESLAVDPGISASSLVSEINYPFITLIRSPSYILGDNDDEGILQNIRGKEDFIAGLKRVWASFFSARSVAYRDKHSINSFGAGVMVQKMKKSEQSATAIYDTEADRIIIESFLGLHDFGIEKILGKDFHEVNPDDLSITKSDIKTQEYALLRDPETYKLEKEELGEQGKRQKIDDKQVYEAARITKRIRSFLGKNIKLYLGIRRAYTYVLIVNQRSAEKQVIFKDPEEAKVDESTEKVLEYAHGVSSGSSEQEEPNLSEPVQAEEDKVKAVEMPEILSDEEARAEVKREQNLEDVDEDEAERLDGRDDQEVDEQLKQDLEFLEEIEDQEKPGLGEADKESTAEKSATEESAVHEDIIPGEVEREVNLLQEVLGIKELVEKMEEHALNNNKEAYLHENKKLREMLDDIRHE